MRIYCKVVLRLVSQAINNIQAGVVVEAEAEVLVVVVVVVVVAAITAEASNKALMTAAQ